MKKVLFVLLVMLMTVFLVFPYTIQAFSLGEIMKGADDFVKAGEENIKIPLLDEDGNPKKDENGNLIYPGISEDNIANVVVSIASALLIMGNIVIVVVGMVIGIKYLVASADEKAKLKQSLIGLVISAIVIYGAFGIWSLVYNVLNNNL